MSASPPTAPPSLPALDQAVQTHLHDLETRLTQLSHQLRHAQKLASIGTMSAILAHEFKNLLTPVVTYVQYALDKNDPQLTNTALQTALRQSDKVTTLCEHILGLATNQDQGPIPVPLKQIVDETVHCLGRDLAKDNITLVIDIDPALKLRANPGQLQQVLFNLILNARQAMLGRPGTLTLAASHLDQSVQLLVQDTGVGINPDDLPHIFEPFFTTRRHANRPDKRGIGLGLAICKDIIDDHGGTIEARSHPNAGTTFTLTLPAAD